MKELAVSAIGATGTVGCSDDICPFLSLSFTLSPSTAQNLLFSVT